MAKRVFKYPIETEDRQNIQIHKGYQILTVDTQNEKPCIWALVDDEAPIIVASIRTHGTGHEVYEPDNLQYIGSYQLLKGRLVFHVFEDKIPT